MLGNIGTNSAQANSLTVQAKVIRHNYLVSKHTIAWFNGSGRWSLYPHVDKCKQLDGKKAENLCYKQRLTLQAHAKRYYRLDEVLHPKYDWLDGAFACIHHYEGSWNSNTGNGYYGGLQMDLTFQNMYGPQYVKKWGTADNWPVWAQLDAAKKAYNSGRGFGPWPRTAVACHLA